MTREEELEKSFNEGKEYGRIEGMMIYQNHLIQNLQSEREKLNQKLKTLKNNGKYGNTNKKGSD